MQPALCTRVPSGGLCAYCTHDCCWSTRARGSLRERDGRDSPGSRLADTWNLFKRCVVLCCVVPALAGPGSGVPLLRVNLQEVVFVPTPLLINSSLHDAEGFSDTEKLTLRVALEAVEGETSFWAPYLALLPAADALNTALYVMLTDARPALVAVRGV
jgi:hypothetical protein